MATIHTLKKVTKITVRDSASVNFLESMGIKAELTSDPVWLGLTTEIEKNTIFEDYNIKDNDNILGINLRPWQNVGMLELQEFARTISKMAIEDNLKPVIIPLQNEQDVNICNDFYNILLTVNPELDAVLIDKSYSPTDWDSFIKNCNLIIAMRFHALICALIHNIELFGISYDPKVKNIMEDSKAFYITVKQWRERELPAKLINWNSERKSGLTYTLNLEEKVNSAKKTIEQLVATVKEISEQGY